MNISIKSDQRLQVKLTLGTNHHLIPDSYLRNRTQCSFKFNYTTPAYFAKTSLIWNQKQAPVLVIFLPNYLNIENTKTTLWKMLVQEYLKNKEYLRNNDKAKNDMMYQDI